MLKAALREVLDVLYDGLVVFGPDGRILEHNARALEMLELTPEELRGKFVSDPNWGLERPDGSPFPGEDLPSERARRLKVPVRDEPITVKSGRAGRKHLLVSAIPRLDPATGEVEFVIGVFLDRTEIRRRDAELAASRELLEQAQALAKIAVSSIDVASKSVVLGPSLARAGGLPEREQSLTDLVARVQESERPVLEQKLAAALAGQLTEPFDVRARRATDDYGHHRVWLHPMRDASGAVTRVLAISQDVTEFVRMRQELHDAERLASLGSLAAGVAHEINNPLTYTLANLEMLQQELESVGMPPGAELDRIRRALADARDGAERVRRIVGDLRTFTKRAPSPPHSVDLERALDVALTMSQNVVKHRARVVRETKGMPHVLGDEAQIAQVFVNLLVNAANALPENQAQSRVITLAARLEGAKVVTAVRDDREPMSADALAKVFEPYAGANGAAHVHDGLGLFVTQGLVKELGGEVSASCDGRLTTFEVRLPVAAPVERPSAAPEAKRARVLVVDDEPLVRQAIARLLGHTHDVVVAADGPTALAALGKPDPFDVVLCDLMMPEMSGIDLYESAATVGKRPRFVFMTGGVFTERAQDFLDTERPPVLEKPFSLAALLSALQS